MFATCFARSHSGAEGSFQYPVFGSSVCNTSIPFPCTCTGALSVPCVRVECLQLIVLCGGVLRPIPFSTLCSGRVFATAKVFDGEIGGDNFQYPVFGSSVCNQVGEIAGARAAALSVPCVRVECLQPLDPAVTVHAFVTFSTLCSGRVFATYSPWQLMSGNRSFSTLCSGRVFATQPPRQ